MALEISPTEHLQKSDTSFRHVHSFLCSACIFRYTLNGRQSFRANFLGATDTINQTVCHFYRPIISSMALEISSTGQLQKSDTSWCHRHLFLNEDNTVQSMHLLMFFVTHADALARVGRNTESTGRGTIHHRKPCFNSQGKLMFHANRFEDQQLIGWG